MADLFAYSGDPVHSAVSNLGLHCLSLTLLGSAHYENTPFEIYRKFYHPQKNENFQIKIWIFFIFLLKI